ncbi:hypothetical protein M747DRAFT_41008 [Aspergillus niger ATCC 13496]|uniref:Uncharacterized protein n=1 Tax=Aspergillus niger ATCC 13496 TaxID=1353008 RepID=A0A370BXN8_ASPNG|nr:hypothetical protein M747DRAFT_41008 [Aspergillus niger ATCC 13496]
MAVEAAKGILRHGRARLGSLEGAVTLRAVIGYLVFTRGENRPIKVTADPPRLPSRLRFPLLRYFLCLFARCHRFLRLQLPLGPFCGVLSLLEGPPKPTIPVTPGRRSNANKKRTV